MNFNLSTAFIFFISFLTQIAFAQNSQVPEMPIPPEFQQPQQGQPPQGTPPPGAPPAQPPPTAQPPPQQGQMNTPPPQQIPPQQPPPPQGQMNTPPPQMNPPVQQPVAQPAPNQPTTPSPAQMPSDFELIAIKPYFKNKPKLGHLTATLYSANNEILGTVTGDFGDCKTCIRGASVKSKIGVRLYGNEVSKLTVSRKQSSSIQITACNANNNMPLVNNIFNCEFMHNNTKMKLTLKLD